MGDLESHALWRCLGVILLLALGMRTWAATVTLAWSEEANVAGYRRYMGVASRNYTNSMDVGPQTSCQVSNLIEGVTYYFTVTSYDAKGLESPYSNEVAYWCGPQPPRLQLNEVLVRQPVQFQCSTNLRDWVPAGTGCAWLVQPATNAYMFFRAIDFPLTIVKEP